MSVCKEIEKIDQCQDVRPERKRRRKTKIFRCSVCKYESNREFNVIRHESRIHIKEIPRVCCTNLFLTKGEYYIHCEQEHPETRANAITSRKKYKITGDMDIVAISKNVVKPSEEEDCVQLPQRFSERIRNRKLREMKSNLSLKYSVTYTDIDIEDVPLIRFVTDHRPNTRQGAQLPSKSAEKRNKKQKEKTNPTVKIAISSEQNIENAASENRVENRTTISNSSRSSFSVELPTKKLILQRFRTNVMHEFKIPLQDQNNNNIRQNVNFEEGRENALPVRQNRPKYSKRTSRANKENLPKFAFSLEQRLEIKLDTEIAGPMVTQLHRDFLASIDFDKYKIF